jgi:SAM-dependent methyltransferase
LTRNQEKDWANRVYETNASIYQSILEAGLKTAPAEVKGIAKLFKRNGIPDGSNVLDVACGIGRHSIYLAKAGYRVTGIDPSYTFLRRARKLAREESVSEYAHFSRGRFSNLLRVLSRSGPKKFGGIVLMDYSVGVTGQDEDDLQLFKDLTLVATKGAVLVVEIFDRNWFTKHAGSSLTEEFPDNLVRKWNRLSALGSPILEADWAFYGKRADQSLKHLFTTKVCTRHYSVAELKRLVGKAGWKYSTCYGSLEGLRRFTENDFRAFLVFTR